MKNKTMKKVISTVMVGTMAASMLAGCGGSSSAEPAPATEAETKTEQTEATENTAAETETTTEASGDVVTIKLTRPVFNLANTDTDQLQKVNDAINEYIKDKIGVQVEITEISSGEYTDKANLALANNEINLLWTASWEAVIGTNDLTAQNAVYDLSNLLPGTDLYASMDEGQWEATKYDGKNYFVPVYKDNVEGYDVMFRQDLIDKFGWDITTVKTMRDIEPMLEDIKNDGIKYPFIDQNTALFYRLCIDDFDFFTADSTSNWVAVDKETNEVVNTVQSPEYKEFVTMMSEWAEKGYISEDEVTKSTSQTALQTQDWGIGIWTDIPINDEADARNMQDCTVVPVTSRWAHSTSALGSCYCVTANSTEAEAKAALDFLGLLYTDSKLADLYTFGIEGEDFSYNADGLVEQNSEKYNHSMWESASATIVTPLSVEPADKGSLYKEFNSSAKVSPAAGFRFDRGPVEAQYAACQNVFNTYGYPLEQGGFAVADIDATIEAYQAALDEAGYQDILTEFTNQYEAWKSAN